MGGTIRERARTKTVDASANAEPAFVVLVTIATAAIAWLLTYWAGGSRTAGPHAFYVPVVIAAIRFGNRAALAASLAVGVLAGPLMPLHVQDGTNQDLGNWTARLAAFVIVGQLVAFLSRHSLSALTSELGDRRFRAELDAALTGDQISLLYQPIIDLSTGRLTGVEALVRWNHPTHGLVPPDRFVVRAERVGCVQLLTRHVLTEACDQLERWCTAGHLDDVGFELAVNVSATDVADESLCPFISELLNNHAFPAHWLHLEVTETALVDDIDTMVTRLMDLRMLGIRLAIDDFGTGESSLGHLQRFPIDTLKVDRIFVSRMEHEHGNDVIAHGIIALAHAMQLATIAEGIETTAQAQRLLSFGCTHGQGYLIAKPLDLEAINEILREPKLFSARNHDLIHTSSATVEPHPDVAARHRPSSDPERRH